MALIFEPFAESELIFGCAQKLWNLLGMVVALDVSMLSRRLSDSPPNQGSLTSYKTSSTFDWNNYWSVQLAVRHMEKKGRQPAATTSLSAF